MSDTEIKAVFIVNTRIDNNVGRRVQGLINTINKFNSDIKVEYASYYESSIPKRIIDLIKILFSKSMIVHIIEPFGPSFIFLPFFRIFRKKIIYQTGDVHYLNAQFIGLKSAKFSTISKLSEKIHYIFSNVFVVGSLGLKEFLVTEMNISADRILRVNYLGCPDIIGKDNANQIKQQNSLTPLIEIDSKISGQFIIAYSAALWIMNIQGKMIPRGWEIPFIIKALRDKGHNDVVALVTGDGPGKDKIEEISQNLGVKDAVLIVGNISRDLYFSFLKRAHICFVESFDDKTYQMKDPSKISDYVQVDCPFIWSSNKESKLWKDYPLLVKPPDLKNDIYKLNGNYISSIAKLIDLYIADKSFRQRCVLSFKELKENFPNWDSISRSVMDIYRSLL